jgi:hypothetical protein
MTPKDIEALINIAANAGEIVACGTGGPALFFCWIPKVNKLPGYTKKLAFAGLIQVLIGLAIPNIANWLYSNSNLMPCLIITLLLSALVGIYGLALYFVPFYIAKYVRKKKAVIWIGLCNVFAALIPFGWVFTLIWACFPNKEELAAPIPDTPVS